MTYRKAMHVRTWLSGTEYDLLASNTALHWDLFAFTDMADCPWFVMEAREGGQRRVAGSVYRYDKATGTLEERTMTPTLEPLMWTRDTHGLFRRVHRALLAACIMLPGYNRKSVHCHYVPVPDCDPWPRGTVNTWRYEMKDGGAGRQRSRQFGAAWGSERPPLPDLL